MRRGYVMSLDLGTTSSRAMIFDHDARPVAFAAREFPQMYPRPGWVEHDPMDIARRGVPCRPRDGLLEGQGRIGQGLACREAVRACYGRG
jgi:glycerol kinase